MARTNSRSKTYPELRRLGHYLAKPRPKKVRVKKEPVYHKFNEAPKVPRIKGRFTLSRAKREKNLKWDEENYQYDIANNNPSGAAWAKKREEYNKRKMEPSQHLKAIRANRNFNPYDRAIKSERKNSSVKGQTTYMTGVAPSKTLGVSHGGSTSVRVAEGP